MSFKTNLLVDLSTDEFILIGIYSLYEDYRLAFFLNQLLNWHFERCFLDLDISFKDHVAKFPIFKSTSNEGKVSIYLISNQINKAVKTKVANSLFEEDFESTSLVRFLPEFKDFNYIIKIEDDRDRIAVNSIIKKINTTNLDITAVIIPNEQLKSKSHLVIN